MKTLPKTLLVVSMFLVGFLAVRSPRAGPTPGRSVDRAITLAGLSPVEDRPVIAMETTALESIFLQYDAATAAIMPGPEAGAQRRLLALQLQGELYTFTTNYPSSTWTPSINLVLARAARLRCSYGTAIDQYWQVWLAVRGLSGSTAIKLGMEANRNLAELLAMSGRIEEFDFLRQDVDSLGESTVGAEWNAAIEMRTWVEKYPTDIYKCGLECLDQLGRLTQPGQFVPGNITDIGSSTNGFTAADLVQIGQQNGLRVHAAMLTDPSNPPVPSILHLSSEHFILIRGRQGAFYEVIDPAGGARRWLLGTEIAEEASGCAVLSDVVAPNGSVATSLDLSAAAGYRGRAVARAYFHHDNGPDCDGGGGDGSEGGNSYAPGDNDGVCTLCGGGMPVWGVSESFMNLWLIDRPLEYKPAYGPDVVLRLAYNANNDVSLVSGVARRGATFGNQDGLWSCSWLSWAELDSSESLLDVAVPWGGWATFNFPANSSVSSTEYYHNLWAEKLGPAGGITNVVVHLTDGSQIEYGVLDLATATNAVTPFAGLFYMSSDSDPAGVRTTFAYDSNFYLTNVTAADGTTFALQHNNGTVPALVTGVSSSYGSSVTPTYSVGGTHGFYAMTNITDTAGISSGFAYSGYSQGEITGGPVTNLVTAYGTTVFNTAGDNGNQGIFARTVRITFPNGTQEFWALLTTYTGGDWTNFVSAQIPTNTPVGTLDTATRLQRNTFHWNAQQFANYVNTSLSSFNWVAFRNGRIRHWLKSTDPYYPYLETLSLQQDPSPDGGTTDGQITWYDYAGKPANVTYEIGTQIRPSVIARVMPDGTTWYKYYTRLTNGLPTNLTEAWLDSGSVSTRSEAWAYAANHMDLLAWTNALNVLALSNVFNSYHQMVTNYDALGQQTTHAYDGTTHQITNATYPSGLVTAYSYDGNHRLQQVTDSPVNRTKSYSWNADGTIFSFTDPRGMCVTNFWDGLHRLTGVLYPDGTTTSNLYSRGSAFPNGTGGLNILDLTASKDRMGYWTYYDYDALRRRVAVTNANAVVSRYGYCDCGAVSYITNGWNTSVQQVTTNNYDNQGNRITINYADGYNVTNWFDSLRRKTVSGDGTGYRWFFYDNLGRQTTVSNAYGAEEVKSYDVLDHPVYVTDANGVTITNTYDNLSRLLTRGYPDGGVERFGYSARGLIAYTNQINATNFFGYDELGRKTAETNANAEIIRYTNSAAGDLLSLTDGKSQRTKWNYDEYGRVTNKVDQAGTVVLKYNYDPDSRLTNRWSLEKGNTKYAYDLVANLTNIDYPSSTDVKLQYDALNRLTKMIDASGTNTYSYTAAGQILTEDGPFASDTVTNTYVNRLRTALSLQQPSGVWTNGFIYDAARRLTNVTSSAGSFGNVYVTGVGGASGYSSSLLQQLLLGNGSVITNNFDPVGRLLATHLRTSAGVLTNKHEYLYDLAGQRTNETRMDASTLVYSHDKIGQLKVSDSSVNSEDRGYFYDSAWNLNRRTNNGATYTFTVDNKNQLTSDPNCADYYDGNGNLTRRTLYGADYNIYSYDDENRLVSMSFLYGAASSQWQTVWSYDGLGRLRSRVDYTYSNGGGGWLYSTTTCYIYDGFRVIQERDGNNTPAVSYTRGNDLSGSFEGAGGIGGLLARSSGYSSGNFTSHAYYHADAGGNITFMLNSSQSMVAKYRYDPFGNTISSSGSLWGANLYRFSSKEIHAPSGMYYYLYRFYDPYLQRWINRDPLQEWGGLNLYTFVLNSPVISVDALGKSIYDDLSNTNCIAQLRKPKLMPLTQSRADQQLLVQASKQALEYEKTVYKKSKQHLENWEFLEAVNVFLAEDGRILPFPIERPPGAKPKDK